MKSSFVQLEQEGSRLNQVGRWRFNVTKRKSQALGACVHWTDNSSPGDMDTWPPVHVNAAKFPVLSRRRCLSKPGQTTGLPLPSINGSRSQADPVSTHRPEPVQPKTCPRSMWTRKSVLGVFIGQGRTGILKSELVAGAGHQASIQTARHGMSPLGPLVRPRKDLSGPGSNHRRAEHDACLTDPKQQRNFCSSDSAGETEAESRADKDGGQTLEDGDDDEDYSVQRIREGDDDEDYNKQRIREWILDVNSCLFSKGQEELTKATHTQELDVATIKIVYGGE